VIDKKPPDETDSHATNWEDLRSGVIYTHPLTLDFKLIRIDENDMVVLPMGSNKAYTWGTEHMCKTYAFKEVG